MKQIIIILFFSIVLVSNSIAQVIIHKSKDIVLLWGRKYYIHTVKPGETLYSISKVYQVPQSDILLINKEIVENLKAGDKLRIPVKDKNYKPENFNKITFINYKVRRRRESLYSIAKKFDVSQDQIIKYNPQIVNGIKKGMILKIPQVETISVYGEDEFFYYYQTKPNDSLPKIAKKYKTTIAEILEFNPQAKNLKPGMILAIPKKKFTEDEKYILKFNRQNIPDFVNIDTNFFIDPNYPPCYKFKYQQNMTFNVALLLPLFITENYTLSAEAAAKPDNIKFFDKTSIFYDFLLGIMLGIHQLQNDSLNIHLFIYDTKADSNTIKYILSNDNFKNMDIAIGPVYSKNYNVVRYYSHKYRINFISPFSKRKAILKNNPFVFNIIPSDSILVDEIIKYVSKQDTADIYIVDDGSPEIEKFKKQIQKTIDQQNITRPLPQNLKTIPFSKFITPYKENINNLKPAIVIAPYKDEIKVTSILNNLNALNKSFNYKITVFGLPQWDNFKNIDGEWISNLQIHFPSFYFIDYDDPEVKSFMKNYTKLFHRKPSLYAFRGYDIIKYFMYTLKRYGKYFQFCLSEPAPFTNQMFLNMKFKRINPTDGFENQGVFMIHYDKQLNLEKIY